MVFAPEHDWKTYRSIVWEHEIKRIRNQTPAERFERYAQLFELVYQARPAGGRDSESEVHRWKEKEAVRQRMVQAFLKMDEWKRAKNDSTNAS